MTDDNWAEYKRLVLKELERLDGASKDSIEKRLCCAKEVDERLDKLETAMAVIQTKVIMASAIVSTIFAAGIGIAFRLMAGG